MQATKNALSLYFTRTKDPGFLAPYVVISYSLGAEIENPSSLTPEIVLAIIRMLVQITEKLKALIKLVAKIHFHNLWHSVDN